MIFSANLRTRGHATEPATHVFRIGQMVRMKVRIGSSSRTAELYRITATMPARDNSPQYRIRSDDERHERVASQDSLEPAVSPAAGNASTLLEKTFGNGRGTKTH